jgi:outer membrane lipoprotein LolB
VAALALAGCATTPPAPQVGVTPDAAQLQQWTATGRMAIAAADQGGSGSFAWRQDGATTELDLRGPLGAGGARLVVTPESVTFADGSGRSLDAEAARTELAARLGADLPWGQLRYWMLGLPAPGEVAAVQDAAAAPWRVIEQSGWRLAYEAFVNVQGLSLPQRFTAERARVRVKVIVDGWVTAVAAGEQVR